MLVTFIIFCSYTDGGSCGDSQATEEEAGESRINGPISVSHTHTHTRSKCFDWLNFTTDMQ